MTSNEAVNGHDLDDAADLVFARTAAAHPETVSTDETYPGWTPDLGCVPSGNDWTF